MPLLTVNSSESLKQLHEEGFDCFDGIEVGPWFQPQEIVQLRERYAGKPFYFHLGNILSPVKKGKAFFNQLRQYLACTDTPWVSCHTELLPRHVFYLGQHAGIRLPPPTSEKGIQQFTRALEQVKAASSPLPILLENMHSLRGRQYDYAASPEIIAILLEQSNADFLLDIAHARVAAAFQHQEIHRYIERFPLNKLAQIHVSGVREINGHLQDAHESMQEEDYALLAWLLSISKPQVVTLEYIREKAPLKAQLSRLKKLVPET